MIEEAVFRGYLLSLLERRSVVVGIVGSSMMFSLVHLNPSSPWACAQHLPFALAMAICAIAYRSLYPPIVAHAAWNLLVNLGLSPARWFDATPITLGVSAALFVLCAAALLRRSGSSPRSHPR